MLTPPILSAFFCGFSALPARAALLCGRPLAKGHQGSYICHEGEPVIMKVYQDEKGQLMASRPAGEYRMVHCGEGWFQFYNKDNELMGRCHFWVRDGKAWGVQVYTRIYQRIED